MNSIDEKDRSMVKRLDEAHEKWEKAFYLVTKAIIEAQIVINEMKKEIESEISVMRGK